MFSLCGVNRSPDWLISRPLRWLRGHKRFYHFSLSCRFAEGLDVADLSQDGKFASVSLQKTFHIDARSKVALWPLKEHDIERWRQLIYLISKIFNVTTLDARLIVFVRATGAREEINGDVASAIVRETIKGVSIIVNAHRKACRTRGKASRRRESGG